ncbi:hypothetical protein EMPS_01185 [Entomortierella parvispora]|uniref:DUF7905 domain-containing protein n=1 Tax=Entomortierella parvispora TaxID=205924 RepID=A0A9P3H2J1_9FUNG|nr:hypothetical protein EMPS_01185 [Entomortierella parvispora]
MDSDDERALEWQSSPPTTTETQQEHATTNQTQEPAPCDDCWFIPAYCPMDVIRGQLEHIGQNTSTHLALFEERVNLWGSPECIVDAKNALRVAAEYYLEHHKGEVRAKRSKGWAKPERELTPTERKKKERAERREQESQKYLGQPTEILPFVFSFLWPKEMSVSFMLGGNLQALNGIRTEFESFIWMEKLREDVKIFVAGHNEGRSETAMNRILNFCMIQKRKMSSDPPILHVLERPSKPVQICRVGESPIKYISLPPTLARPPENINPLMFLKARILGHYEDLSQIDAGLISSSDNPNLSSDEVKVLEWIGKMTINNVSRIRRKILESLQIAQLLNRDYKMRLRIGLVGLRTYPHSDKWNVMEADTRIIQTSRLISEFNPYITSNKAVFERLLNRLQVSDPLQAMRPEAMWSFDILKRAQAVNQDPDQVELEVTFRPDGKVALWNALVDKVTPMDIRVVSSERRLSWNWVLVSGRRLPCEKFGLEGEFVHKLSLDPRTDRLSYSNTDNIQLKRVRREQKTLFTCGSWIYELKSEYFWSLERLFRPCQIAVLEQTPDAQVYSISMYQESWAGRFSDNPHLGFGQPADWSPEDFVSGEEDLLSTLEAVSKLRAMVDEVI